MSRSSPKGQMECKRASFMLDDTFTSYTSYRLYREFCQLDTPRHAVQPKTRENFKKLLRTFDELYEHVLKYINESNRKYTCRLLHCVAVSHRFLFVEELAKIFTFDTARVSFRRSAAKQTRNFPPMYSSRSPSSTSGALGWCSSLIYLSKSF